MATSDADDPQVLQRVFDRLASTPDDRLQAVLSKLLPKLVQMMEKDNLRPQVLEILSHILKRVKPNESIQLPLL